MSSTSASSISCPGTNAVCSANSRAVTCSVDTGLAVAACIRTTDSHASGQRAVLAVGTRSSGTGSAAARSSFKLEVEHVGLRFLVGDGLRGTVLPDGTIDEPGGILDTLASGVSFQ